MKITSNFFLIIIFSGFVSNLQSQINLVPNPSFEFTIGCPVSAGNWNMCSNWDNVNMNLGIGLWGTPDFYHQCGAPATSPPNVFSGICSPQTGLGMMSIVVYNMGYANYREYISSPLTCNMKPGNTYTVSFWLTNGTGYLSPWTIKNIGVHFSVGPLAQSGYLPINVTPQCEIASNVVSTTWVQYTFTVLSTASWDHLTLGAFRSDNFNNVTLSWPNPGGPPSAYANYYVDDVNVFAATGGSVSPTISVSPNTAFICSGQSATLTALGSNNYSWSTGSFASSIVVSPIISTMYSLSSYTGSGCVQALSNTTVQLIVYPSPTVSIVGVKEVCKGSSITLTASGAQLYQWNTGASSQNIVVAPTANTVYSVVGTSSNCTSSAIYSISVLPVPTIAISGNTLLCLGQSAILSATGAGNYQWNTGVVGSTLSISPSSTTTYSLSGSMGIFPCAGSAAITVSVSECLEIRSILYQEDRLSVFPNPVQNIVNLKFNFKLESLPTIEIINSYGLKVYDSRIDIEKISFRGESISIKFDEFLSKGMYLIKVSLDNSTLILKMLKDSN